MYKIIDLCSGIGGIRTGFELTKKFETVLSCENDSFCCKTYEHLYGENPFGDITSRHFKNVVKETEYDVLVAGFPCQSFSIAGRGEGFNDKTRGTIFFEISEIIKMTKPKVIFLENVSGLISHDSGNTIKTIIEVLTKLGYVLPITSLDKKTLKEEIVRCTRNFGLPQKRARTYIVCFRKDILKKDYNLPSIPLKTNKTIFNSVTSMLDPIVNEKYYLSQQYLETLKKHKNKHKNLKNGFGYVVVNDGDNILANTILASGGSGKEKNLIRDLRKDFVGIIVKNKRTPLNSEGIRVMTPNEWAKLQGFKGYAFLKKDVDHFSFPNEISDTQKYKQLGNSVSIPVIEEMARYILDVLRDNEN